MRAWLAETAPATFAGWHADTAVPTLVTETWLPWVACIDAVDVPYVRWFVGGLTNAAFNEIDRHVLDEHGTATAFIADSGNSTNERMRLHELLLESVLAASTLAALCGLTSGARLAMYLPNDHNDYNKQCISERMGPLCCLFVRNRNPA